MSVLSEVSITLPDRRALRDAKRSEFFKEHGLKPCYDIFEISLSPEDANSNIKKCMAIARRIHAGDISAIEVTTLEFTALGLFPGYGGHLTFRSTDPDLLFKKYFQYDV